jgi:hypothetical protein
MHPFTFVLEFLGLILSWDVQLFRGSACFSSVSPDTLRNSVLGQGHAVSQWLKHIATSWKVVISRPDEVNAFFFLFHPAALWALGFTQPLTEMSTRNLPESKRRPVHNAEPVVYPSDIQTFFVRLPPDVTYLNFVPPPPPSCWCIIQVIHSL